MYTLTIEIKSPKMRELIANLADKDLMSVLSQKLPLGRALASLVGLPDAPQNTE